MHTYTHTHTHSSVPGLTLMHRYIIDSIAINARTPSIGAPQGPISGHKTEWTLKQDRNGGRM